MTLKIKSIRVYILHSKKIVLCLIIILSACQRVEAQNLDSVIAKLFFNAPLNGEGSQIMNYFDTLEQLSISQNPIRVSFNLEPDSSIVTPTYKFKKRNFFNFKFESGFLTLVAIKITSGVLVLQLSVYLSFPTEDTQLIAFDYLKNDLSNYPYKRTLINVGNNPLEEIKFKNSGQSGSLSLSKSKNENEFYVYIHNSRMNLSE